MHRTRITIDLNALIHNYKAMAQFAPQTRRGVVVKADAYGLGINKVCQQLYEAGCDIFFTATLAEAIEVRHILPDVDIYAFEGFDKKTLLLHKKHNIIPVINDAEMLGIVEGKGLKSALHIDTAMSRLGLHLSDIQKNKSSIQKMIDQNDIALLMTHISCADLVDHPMNQYQIQKIDNIKSLFPDTPISMANSSAVMHHKSMHHDIYRIGTALYGGITDSALKAVVTLEGQILQIRKVFKGEAVGYAATYVAKNDMMVATISGGYADGVPRHLSSTNYKLYYDGYYCPLLGRVSMDSVMVDISHLPEKMHKKGAWLEFFGVHNPLDEVAELAHTISYGILTGLGRRPERIYIS